jgi:hypothetical protein
VTATPRYPYRVRLIGGRNVHSARPVNGGADRTTACGYYLPHGSDNDWRDETTAVSCTRCVRQQADEESY